MRDERELATLPKAQSPARILHITKSGDKEKMVMINIFVGICAVSVIYFAIAYTSRTRKIRMAQEFQRKLVQSFKDELFNDLKEGF